MNRHKKLLLSVVAASATLVTAVLTTIAPRSAEAQAGVYIPGTIKHCPILFIANMNGQNLYLTQNCVICGSDYVWTEWWHITIGGCGECGWQTDCLDPIYVPIYGFNDVQPANKGPIPDPSNLVADAEKAVGPTVTLENGMKLELSGRTHVASHQHEYAAMRSGAPGQSQFASGRLKLNSDFVSHSGDSDFVAQVAFDDGSTRFFRLFELAVKTDGTAAQSFMRFGQEVDPAGVTDDLEVRSAKVVKSIGAESHQIQLVGETDRCFVVTTVKPVLVK